MGIGNAALSPLVTKQVIDLYLKPLLIGADLVKPVHDLALAYDDPLGVSAAFNLNVLQRINRELDGDFDIRAFRHRAQWNAACSRMDMFLVSTAR